MWLRYSGPNYAILPVPPLRHLRALPPFLCPAAGGVSIGRRTTANSTHARDDVIRRFAINGVG